MHNFSDIKINHNSTSEINGNGFVHLSELEQEKLTEIDTEGLLTAEEKADLLEAQNVIDGGTY